MSLILPSIREFIIFENSSCSISYAEIIEIFSDRKISSMAFFIVSELRGMSKDFLDFS